MLRCKYLYTICAQRVGKSLQGSYALCAYREAKLMLARKKKRPPQGERYKMPTGNGRWLAGACCPGDAANVTTRNTEVVQFAVAHAAKLGDRLTVLAPIVERACYVHDNPLSWAFEAQLPVLGASFASMRGM